MTRDCGDIIIRIDDIRRAGHCVRGAGRYFEAHGMDFRSFIKNGIPADEFIEKGDALALRVVQRKIEREAHGEE